MSNTVSDCVLSIGIVVYYPNFEVLAKTLMQLEASVKAANISAICYLINNAQDHNAVDALEQFVKKFSLNVKIINNPQNNGYGAGNNLAIRATQAPYHLVLNPDAFLHEDALRNALAYMQEHKDVGLLCPRIFNEDGTQQFVHRKNPRLFDMFLRSFAPRFIQKLFARRMHEFQLMHLDWNHEHNIQSPSGCCMLFRMSTLKAIGGFDERYFMYYEDSDIGREIAKVAQVKYLPSFKVTHLWERAARKSFKMKKVMIKSGLLYFWKWK